MPRLAHALQISPGSSAHFSAWVRRSGAQSRRHTQQLLEPCRTLVCADRAARLSPELAPCHWSANESHLGSISLMGASREH